MAIYTDPMRQPPTSTALSIWGRTTLSVYTAFLRSPAASNLHITSASLCTPGPVPGQVRLACLNPGRNGRKERDLREWRDWGAWWDPLEPLSPLSTLVSCSDRGAPT